MAVSGHVMLASSPSTLTAREAQEKTDEVSKTEGGSKVPWSLEAVREAHKKTKGSKLFPWNSPVEDEGVGVREAHEKTKTKGNPVEDEAARKGSKVPWNPVEDEALRALVRKHGAQKWSAICRDIPGRSAKSCRLRWCNHLLPGLNLKPFTSEEDFKIAELHGKYGSRWAAIARLMPGRSDNAIKNRWNCSLKSNQQRYTPPPANTKRSDDDDDGYSHGYGYDDPEGSSVAAQSCKRDLGQLLSKPPKPNSSRRREKKIRVDETMVFNLKPHPGSNNLLAAQEEFWHHQEEEKVSETSRYFTRFDVDCGIDDPMTTLTLGLPGYRSYPNSSVKDEDEESLDSSESGHSCDDKSCSRSCSRSRSRSRSCSRSLQSSCSSKSQEEMVILQ